MNTRQHPRPQPQFQLRNAVLLMAIAAAYPVSVQAAGTAGVAQFAVGDVSLRRADGRTDALVKGKDIGSGEAIVTGPTGRAQVKFTDGGLVSLQPNTEFKVANYVDQADPKEDRFLVDLLRGSMRAITGLIGKRNRDNYKVTTTTATIGIRGSGFNAGYNPDGSLGVTTEFDGIEVCNAAGCVGLTAGESVVVVNNTTLPVRTNTRAEVPTPETKQEAVVAGNQTSETGVSAVVPPAPAPAPSPAPAPAPVTRRLLTGVALTSIGVTTDGERRIDLRSSVNGALVVGDGINAANITQPTAYTGDNALIGTGTSSAPRTLISSTGSLEAGDYLALGTWGGTTWVTPAGESVTIGATAFAAGSPSPLTAISALTGMRASYALRNATPIFSDTGDSGTLLSSSRLNVDFSGSRNYADVSLDVSMASQLSYNLRGGVSGTGAGFSGPLAVSGSGCNGEARYCDFGRVAGTFSGANAQNALISFAGYSDDSGIFSGAATFARGTVQVTPSSNTLTDLQVSLINGSTGSYASNYSTAFGSGTVKTSFLGEKLLSFTQDSSTVKTMLQNTTPATGEFGAIGVISDADFLGWGNWVAGTKDTVPSPGYGSATSAMLNSVHYLVGRPTANINMPTSGVATYALIGGTVPTATLNNVTTSGKLIDAGLTANFTTSRMDINIATQFGAKAVDITEQQIFLSRGNANFSGNSVNGFFTGNQAMRAGVVYNKTDATLGTISGAAAFQRSSFTGATTVVTGTTPVQ